MRVHGDARKFYGDREAFYYRHNLMYHIGGTSYLPTALHSLARLHIMPYHTTPHFKHRRRARTRLLGPPAQSTAACAVRPTEYHLVSVTVSRESRAFMCASLRVRLCVRAQMTAAPMLQLIRRWAVGGKARGPEMRRTFKARQLVCAEHTFRRR